jgi:transposase-like protein
MDSNMRSAQIRRLEIAETGRRRRWSDDEKLKIVLESMQRPRRAAVRHLALAVVELAAIALSRAGRFGATEIWLRAG